MKLWAADQAAADKACNTNGTEWSFISSSVPFLCPLFFSRSKRVLLQILYPDIPSILPDPLKIIEETVLLIKYMYDDITEVEQHPAR